MPPPQTLAFYRGALELLVAREVPFLVGGSYAFERYTGIARHSKDFDLFIHRDDYVRVSNLLHDELHLHTELTFPHWLGKAFKGEDFIDLIFSGGNGVAVVDDEWFMNGVKSDVFGVSVILAPCEEIIWSKAFVMERERYDGADIAHLLLARAAHLDWERMLRRFDEHWRLLYAQLILFGFIYPSQLDRIPRRLLRELGSRVDEEGRASAQTAEICQGTLISRAQFLVDVDRWGYVDARLAPLGKMTKEEVDHWTAAIE